MRFLKPTLGTALPPLLLIAFAVLPFDFLRYTLYSLLAAPLWPLIQRLGWVYRDKPQFLTYPAAILAATFWAVVLYLFLCTVRRVFTRHEHTTA
jgi:hypothetical protein